MPIGLGTVPNMDAVGRVAELALRAPARAGATRVIAVDGPSGAGKSTFAAGLIDRLGERSPVIHLDDLFPGWDGLDAIVPLLLEWVLQPLADGRNPRYRRFDWAAEQYAEWHEVEMIGRPDTPDLLIIEGVGSGSRPCTPYLALTVWIDAPAELRMARGIERDGEAYRPHWERWARQESALFARENTAGRADVVLDGAAFPDDRNPHRQEWSLPE